ncbi:unnamed protein product [Larinioides sclopetarius]|uniref:Ammonium transporter AmtB-like domain-containing protein n=1 Tax=Larinioides sclopetarius TaxID=280406 RepID=A0AAV1YPT8_9ARAC
MTDETDDGLNPVNADDATWILTASFVIFTMQTGAVSKKNEVNILMKNAVDVILGGLSYWMFGYGLQYGQGPGTSAFCGVGSFLVDTEEDGGVFATFIFQLSFATTATTIVSGAMAERANFNAYIIFSFVNTITYCIPAGWMWGQHGFLKKMGAIDFAGSCAVHLTGGASALVAAVMLKPRLHRYDEGTNSLAMGDPGNAIMGLFTLCYLKNRIFGVSDTVNGILGALVGVTVVGAICAIIVNEAAPFLDKMNVDDPVGAVAVHGVGGILGMTAVGLFVEADPLLNMTGGLNGLFKGGGFYFLFVQLFACVCTASWKAQELLGADYNEHGIRHNGYDYDGMIDHLRRQGFKLHSCKSVTPPRSEWDTYLMDKYLKNQREQQQHPQNGHRMAWDLTTERGSFKNNMKKKVKSCVESCSIS